jgi:hypothetical protein
VASLLPEFFSNEEATEEGKVAIKSPAFSITKVGGTLATLIAAISVAAAKLEGATAVKVAVIAAGTFVLLAYFGLAAVDIVVRQRAAAAKLRWPAGSGAGGSGAVVPLVPDLDGLILQSKHNGDEYELHFAELKDGKVTLVARRDGKSLEPIFQPHN